MIITTCLNSHHEGLFREWFYPSLAKRMRPGDLLVVKRLDDMAADFGTTAFNKLTAAKATHLRDLARFYRDLNTPIFYCDADMMFYGDVMKDVEDMMTAGLFLGSIHMLCADDGNGQFCTGCCVFEPGTWANWMWTNVAANTKHHRDDQETFNLLARQDDAILKHIDFLPERYYTIGKRLGQWPEHQPSDKDVPSDIMLHHANFTIGLTNKLDLLSHVNAIVLARGQTKNTEPQT